MAILVCYDCGYEVPDAEPVPFGTAYDCDGCWGRGTVVPADEVQDYHDADLLAAQRWRLASQGYEPLTEQEARAAIAGGFEVYAINPGDDAPPYRVEDAHDVLGAVLDGHMFWQGRVLDQVNEQVNAAAVPVPEGERLPYVKLALRAIELREARAFIDRHHEHHEPPAGWKFGTAVVDEAGTIRGVIVVARPVAREIANRHPDTLEVVRCCTDRSTKNAASMLYAGAWAAARALGYRRLITYVLESEHGTSLRACGWTRVAHVRGKSWNSKSRQRVDKAPTCDKWRWEITDPGKMSPAAVEAWFATTTKKTPQEAV